MRWRRWTLYLLLLIAAGLWITRPSPLPSDALDGLTGDAAAGEITFAAAGCASCHRAPEASDGPLSGGRSFVSPFGTFYAPNISPHASAGVGNWSDHDLASAIMRGVSPGGAHYYPAFPYDSYQNAAPQDVVDIIAYLRTLPASDTANRPHDVSFPFNIRTSLGGWKLLFARPGWVLDDPATAELERGRYLVEALGHCGACHTPRNVLGGPVTANWLGGAPDPSGQGRIPNITSGGLDWSVEDIASYLESGFTPDFDSAGGEMVDVIANTSQLSDSDRLAIAAYLKAVPPVTAP
ncbi:c-type cytochrome [Yoonia sp. R2331]|uniref:c-type cytochrome n=1 Tax=Yoonia sp. R2331 TaxID=3237238 RepID=UPI0034E3C064